MNPSLNKYGRKGRGGSSVEQESVEESGDFLFSKQKSPASSGREIKLDSEETRAVCESLAGGFS